MNTNRDDLIKWGVAAALAVPLFATSVLFLKAFKSGRYPVHPENSNSVILITGCDSGIGKATAEKLLSQGYHVLATVFTDEGKDGLAPAAKGKEENLTVVFADITKEDSMAELRNTISTLLSENPKKKLVGVVNNAGIATMGPVELQPYSQFKRQVEVNLFGHVLVAQHTIPFLRASQGRLINIVSIAGRISGSCMGAYGASKFAMEAVTDSLRQELRPWNVSVSAIEPGFIRTPLVTNSFAAFEKNWDELGENAREIYKDCYEGGLRGKDKVLGYAIEPVNVANTIYRALSASHPKTRYTVGLDACIIALIVYLPDRVRDVISKMFF